jgi:hypothetical protein
MVSWWAGDGDAMDRVGSNSGVLQGGITFTNGLSGNCFKFDGSSGHVRIADHPSLRFTNAITIEAWINPSRGDGRNVVTKWDATSTSGLGQRAYAMSLGVIGGLSVPSFGVCSNGRDDGVQPVTARMSGTNLALPLNEWTHLAGTYDGGLLRIFVNGVLRGEVPYSNGIFAGNDDLAIGGAVGGVAPGQVLGPFEGLIDEMTVYNRALSAAEIEAVFNAGSAGKCGPLWITLQPLSQLGYWGRSVTFTIEATGLPSLSYQWRKDGNTIAGATNASLVMTNLLLIDAGSYSVSVSNSQGSITSNPAILTINPAGVSADLHFAVTITGVVGFTYGIQATTNLSDTNSWQGLVNITLTQETQEWFDPQPVKHPQRFYRVVPGPITIP